MNLGVYVELKVPDHTSIISVALTVARHTHLFLSLTPHKWSRSQTIRNCRFLSSISKYTGWRSNNITRQSKQSTTKSDGRIGQENRRWAYLFDIWSSRFMSPFISFIMCDFPRRAMSIGGWPGVIARSAPPAQGALGNVLRWIFEGFLQNCNFRCLRFSLRLLFLRNFKKYYPNGIISLFSLISCSTRNAPRRTAISSRSHDFGSHLP